MIQNINDIRFNTAYEQTLFVIYLFVSCQSPEFGGNHVIEKFQLAGPVRLQRPVMIDSVDINGKAFDEQSLLSSPLTTDGGKTFSAGRSSSQVLRSPLRPCLLMPRQPPTSKPPLASPV